MTVNDILKPLISTILVSLLVIVVFSIFKGPYFILVKYYYYRGYSNQNNMDFPKAIDDFTTALKYDNKHIVSYISRGSAYMDLKKYDEAILDYSKAIALDTNDARSYAYRGRAYYELADATKSLNDYNKAISLDNKFDYAYYNRGLLKYTLMKNYQEGCADFIIASDLGMVDASLLLEEGYCK